MPALAVVLSIGAALSLALFQRFQSRATPEPSIAVLPFLNLTADPASQYFADGLTDEIADSLSHRKPLRVIARSSTVRFRGKPVDVREAGRLLNVANVLEGTVQLSGNRVRIVTHLERASDGSIVWSNTYDRTTSDLFAVQAELAAGIAANLKVNPEVSRPSHVPNAEAHELVVRARYEAQQVTPASLTRAEAFFQQAIDRDPEYAAAYSGMASAKYNQSVARGSTGMTDAERGGVERMARKALALDADLPAARGMLALLAMQYDWDWVGAEREFRLAGAGTPSAAIEGQYTYLLLFRSRFAEAHQHIRRLLDLDPYSTVTMFNLAVYRDIEQRYGEAREIARRIAAQYPEMIPPQQLIGHTYFSEGHPEEALKIYRSLEPRFPQILAYEAMAYAAAGQREEALRLIRPYEEKYPDSGVTVQWLAAAYASMGDEANALKWLERSADRHEWAILSLGVNPVFAKMRNSPGFRAIRKRIGLVE